MCQYRYYYYGGCQHQETLLHSLCHRAAALEQSHDEEGADDNQTGTELTTSTTPPQSPAGSLPSPYSTSSLTSLPEPEPPAPITSIFQHTSRSQHPSNLLTIKPGDDMSALAAFSAANIRGMLPCKPKQTVFVTQAEIPASSHVRIPPPHLTLSLLSLLAEQRFS